MGILDRIVNRKIGEAVKNELEKHLNNDDNHKENETITTETTVCEIEPVNPQPTVCEIEPIKTSCESGSCSLKPNNTSHFPRLLKEEFSEYQIKENISGSEIGNTERPYEFGLYKGGGLKAVIVLSEKNKTNNRAYRTAKEAAEKANVAFVNFFTHMPNERSYVIERIKKFLK